MLIRSRNRNGIYIVSKSIAVKDDQTTKLDISQKSFYLDIH